MDTALWVLGRGTGIVALLLLTVSVVLGILTRSGRPLGRLPRFGVQLVHRNAALLATAFTLVHVVTLLFDSQAQLKLVDVIVPFVAAANPFWLGLGTLGLDVMAAIMITALARRWVGRRVFRAVHLATYALWPIAVAHTLGEGSDAATPWMIALTVVCAGTVVAALGWRISSRFRRPGAVALEQTS
jgi:methionine sulfoxide reductase heme-binding subunit